jgi:hypothetical protein
MQCGKDTKLLVVLSNCEHKNTLTFLREPQVGNQLYRISHGEMSRFLERIAGVIKSQNFHMQIYQILEGTKKSDSVNSIVHGGICIVTSIKHVRNSYAVSLFYFKR